MIRTDAELESISPDQCAQVIELVKAYMKENRVTQAQLAQALVLATSTVSQVLAGKYAADARPIVAAMDRWLERRHNADAQPHVITSVDTFVAKMVRLAAVRAISAADAGIDSRISLVWGDPGCGKTMALQAVREKHDGVLITCGVDIMSPRSILEKIAQEIGLRQLPYGANDAFAVIVERLRGSGKLIIVDEIHALLEARNDQAFHTLRLLSDKTGCPQLWAATCDLIQQLQLREHKRQPLGQIIRRIGSQFHLTARLHQGGVEGGGKPEPLFSVEEIIKMYGSNEMKLTRDAGRFLARFCTSPRLGLLGSCTNFVLHATLTHRGKAGTGGLITPEMLWEAMLFLFQTSVVNELKALLREDLAEMKQKQKLAIA